MGEPANIKNASRDRQMVLRQLIRQGDASTQEDLCRALKQKGFNVTQSTISRDLRRIGAIKATNAESEIIYHLPETHQNLAPRLDHDFAMLVTEIQSNESIIVLHTTPGSASLVARHIDGLRASFAVLGTIAGDDAIFVVPASVRKIPAVIRKMKEELWRATKNENNN